MSVIPVLSAHRLVLLSVAFILSILVVFAAWNHGQEAVESPIRKIKDAPAQDSYNDDQNRPIFGEPSFSDSLFRLFTPGKHPITAQTYTDASGTEFNNSNNKYWKHPLGNEVLILDIDTRVPDGENEIWNEEENMNWKKLSAKQKGGMLSAAFLNHYMYSQIHGYDYKYYNPNELEDMHNTWVKPQVLAEYLSSYRFVIFIDADATIQHLELPLEWLFNRWGITPKTSVAMPIDTRQLLNGNKNASNDSKGKITLNTGVIVAQSMPLTLEMMTAWQTCTEEERYPGCAIWKNEWSHEQRAFSEYIRYDFNPDGNNIVEIACDDAMGYPGLHKNHPHILSDCTGQFIRHHTIDKGMTKTSTQEAIMQSISQLAQSSLRKNQQDLWIKEGGSSKGFFDKLGIS